MKKKSMSREMGYLKNLTILQQVFNFGTLSKTKQYMMYVLIPDCKLLLSMESRE
jgi:hypothetical protein